MACICCRCSKVDIWELRRLSTDCERLFSNFRKCRTPASMIEFRSHIKFIFRRFCEYSYRLGDSLNDDFEKILERLAFLITWRGLYLEIEPTIISQMWSRFRLQVDNCLNWDVYMWTYKEIITEFEQWIDKNLHTYYEVTTNLIEEDSDDKNDENNN